MNARQHALPAPKEQLLLTAGEQNLPQILFEEKPLNLDEFFKEKDVDGTDKPQYAKNRVRSGKKV